MRMRRALTAGLAAGLLALSAAACDIEEDSLEGGDPGVGDPGLGDPAEDTPAEP